MTLLVPLPDEILLEIFSKFPVKSLLRFRCISIIASSHLLQQEVAATGHGRPLQQKYQVHDPCPHLSFASLTAAMASSSSASNEIYYLSATWQLRHGPLSPAQPPTEFMHFALAFDPRCSPHYKIFLLPQPKGAADPLVCDRLNIFSSEMGEWAESQGLEGLAQICFYNPRFVFLDGILYVLDVDHGIIMGIDIENMICREIKHPWIGHSVQGSCLGKSGGLLHYALIVDD